MAEDPAILVIGPQWVGDLVMAQSLFAALRARAPNVAIDVAAPRWAAPLLGRMQEVRDAIDLPFARGGIDLGARWRFGRTLRGRYRQAYVLPGSWKSALIPFFAGIPERIGYRREMRYGLLNRLVPLPEALKRKTADAFVGLAGSQTIRPPQLAIDPANQTGLLERFGLEPGRFVAFMPGAEYGPAKRWPAAHFAALANRFADDGLAVTLLGSAKDGEAAAAICAVAPRALDLTGETALVDAVDILAAARLAVSNDSGLMHIAAAVGTPVIGLYGSTSPANTPPLTDRRALVWLGLPCSPCHQRTCPLGHMNCLNGLSVDRVSDAARSLLATAR